MQWSSHSSFLWLGMASLQGCHQDLLCKQRTSPPSQRCWVCPTEDNLSDLQLKKGDRAAVLLAVATLQKQFGSGPLVAGAAPTVKQETPAALLHDLLQPPMPTPTTLARMDLDPHIYLRQEGERHNRKPLLIVDYVASAVRDVEEIHPEAGQHDEAQAVIGRNPTVDSPIGAHMSTPRSLSFSV